MTTEESLHAYVRAALALHGYCLDDIQTAAVAQQFARIAAIAGGLFDPGTSGQTVPLAVFRP
jgi:hypothetical protein